MNRVFLFLAVVLFNGCLLEAASAPALLADLTQSGTQKIVDAVFPTLVSQVQGISIPGASGTSQGFDYSFSDIVVKSISYTNALVTFNNDSTITVELDGLAVVVTLNWHYKLHDWPHTPNGKGSADASCKNSKIVMTLRTTASADGHPVLAVTSSSVKLNDFDINIHGSMFSWLYNILIDLFKNTIKNDVAKAVNSAIAGLVKGAADKALSKLSMKTKLTNVCYLDWSMVADPYFQYPQMVAPLKGEIFSSATPTECPLDHAPLVPTPASQMVQFTVDQFLLNSAFWVYFEAGLLHFTLTDSMLPKSIPIRLNTTEFASIVPQLAARYPNELMKMELRASTTPLITFNQNSSTLEGYSNVAISVLDNGTYVEAFTLSMNASAAMEIFINSTSYPGSSSLAFHVDTFVVSCSLLNSNIGNFDVSTLPYFLNLIANIMVVPFLNDVMGRGIPLPSLEGMSFNNMEILTTVGQIYVNSDLTFSL